jgi:hypothetical protein
VKGRGSSLSASLTAPSVHAPSSPGHEGERPAALSSTRISSTSSADFTRTKFMRRLRHAEEGEHLHDEKR